MAFDALMLSSVINEIKKESLGARVEKVYMPDKDEVQIQIRSRSGGKRLLINAGANNPRVNFTEIPKENPQNPPMFCVLLRKHLTGALLTEIEQPNFERVVIFSFDTKDEMGFDTKCYLVAELMGKFSNLIFLDNQKKVVSALKIVDFTTSMKRQILPTMTYELPPKQDKKNPLTETETGFFESFETANNSIQVDKFLISTYYGLSNALVREVAYRTECKIDALLSDCDKNKLAKNFFEILNNDFNPSMVFENEKPIEYAPIYLSQYGNLTIKEYESPSMMLDEYFESRDRQERVKQKASDILKIVTNAEARIIRKNQKQFDEMSECKDGAKYKKWGDLISNNIYLLQRGMSEVELTDYDDYNEENGEYSKLIVELDKRLTPSQNAQKYYKKYQKYKKREIALSEQIEKSRNELLYIESVLDALSKSENTSDLSEIREELILSGYIQGNKNDKQKKKSAEGIMEFRTSGGYTVYCGKNNIQNKKITHTMAKKNDYWFHAKGVAGSHVLLVTNGEEPSAEDFTEACEIAGYYSKKNAEASIEIDYTLAKNVKKVPEGNIGLVIYHTNYSALVTPSKEKIQKMRIK